MLCRISCGTHPRAIKLGIEKAGFIALLICLCSSPVTVSRPYPVTRPSMLRRYSGCVQSHQMGYSALVGRETNTGELEPVLNQYLVQGVGLHEHQPFNPDRPHYPHHGTIFLHPFMLRSNRLALDEHTRLTHNQVSSGRARNPTERRQ